MLNYNNDIKKVVEIDEVNDDSLGAEFYDISSLTKSCVKLYDWFAYSAYATFKSIGIVIEHIFLELI